MGTLLTIVDFIVVLLLVVQAPPMVWKEQPHGFGPLLLSIFIALAVIVLAIVSSAAFLGLVEGSSSLTRGIFLVVLLGMAAVLRLSWVGKPVTYEIEIRLCQSLIVPSAVRAELHRNKVVSVETSIEGAVAATGAHSSMFM